MRRAGSIPPDMVGRGRRAVPSAGRARGAGMPGVARARSGRDVRGAETRPPPVALDGHDVERAAKAAENADGRPGRRLGAVAIPGHDTAHGAIPQMPT